MLGARSRSLALSVAFGGALLFVIGTFSTTGCARNAVSGDDIVCERVLPTGSHIPRMYCWKASQARDRRINDQEKIRNIQIGSGIKIEPDKPSPPVNQ